MGLGFGNLSGRSGIISIVILFFLLVGYGRRVKFWKTKWYGDEPLSVSFPFICLSCFKEAGVADVWV